MFTFFHGCGIPPVTLTCPQGGHAQAQAQLGPTGTQGCTQPGHCVGPTGTYGCTIVGPTGYQGCHQGHAQAQTIGITGWQGCTVIGPTGYQGCHQGNTQAQTILPPTIGCLTVTTTIATTAGAHAQAQNVVPNTVGCTAITPCPTLPCPAAGNAQAQTIGITGWQGCGQNNNAQAQNTITQGICPTAVVCAVAQPQTIGVTGWHGCTVIGPTGTQGCTVVGPTGYQGCGQNDAAHAQTLGPTAYPGCHQQETIATVCTQIGCDGGEAHAQTLGHTAYQGCGEHGTAATLCTQPSMCGGPTHLLGCTGYEGCHQDTNGGNAQAQVHSIPVANCIPTRSCTGAWPVC